MGRDHTGRRRVATCLALVLAAGAVIAAPKPPQVSDQMPQLLLPNLAVKQVRVWIDPGDPTGQLIVVTVTVKNVGKALAGLSKLALYQVGSTPGYLMNTVGPIDTPTVAAGQTALVEFHCNNAGKALYIVALDVPVTDHPLGQVAEGPNGERNNVFGFPFDADPNKSPQVHNNPAVN